MLRRHRASILGEASSQKCELKYYVLVFKGRCGGKGAGYSIKELALGISNHCTPIDTQMLATCYCSTVRVIR